MIRPGRVWFIALSLMLLAGCSGDPGTPEERVRQLIGEAETAAEARQVGFFADRVDEGFEGRDGGRRELLRMIRGYFIAHQSIHLVAKVDAVQQQGDRVRAVVFAGLAGSPVDGFEQLLAMRAGLYRFDLTFSAEDEPQLLGAQWRRAVVEEVLPGL